MPYLSRFQTDLFVSYGHLDNSPNGQDEERWIARFHKDLERRVNQYLGSEISIWRDNFLQGNQTFPDEIERNLAGTAAWIPILSPRFISSDWCRRELRTFLDAGDRTGGIKVGTRSRIFKVVKTIVDVQEQPEVMRQVLGYEFYRIDENGRPRELPYWDPAPDAEKKYLAKLDDLAYDLHLLLKELKGVQPASSSPAGSIYLAETTKELSDSRDQIRRELLAQGYQVLPDRPLPLETDELKQFVAGQLERCRLSLHLIGGRYGIVPEGDAETRSVVWLQQELAAARQARGNFHSVLWVPPGVAVTDDRQKQYLDRLQEQLRVESRFELLKTSAETMKNYVFDKLTVRPERPSPVSEKRIRIYLVCEQRDLEAIRPIQAYFEGLQYGVDLPLWEGDQAEIRLDHEGFLQDCDGVLIYHGAGSEAWLREKIRDLRRARGLGRKRSFIPQAIYIGPESIDSKKTFVNNEFEIIRNFGPFSAALMDPLIAAIDKILGASA